MSVSVWCMLMKLVLNVKTWRKNESSFAFWKPERRSRWNKKVPMSTFTLKKGITCQKQETKKENQCLQRIFIYIWFFSLSRSFRISFLYVYFGVFFFVFLFIYFIWLFIMFERFFFHFFSRMFSLFLFCESTKIGVHRV